MVATIGSVILLDIIGGIPGLEGAQPVPAHAAVRGLAGAAAHAHRLVADHALAWLCALYALPALFAAYLVFLRRDVAGG